MKRIKLRVLTAGFAAAVVSVAGTAAAGAQSPNSNGSDNPHDNITICHATGSTTNPFVKLTANANGVVSGHQNHQDANDIIPPFSYNDHGTTKSFAGQNWTANGQAIFNNGCVAPTGGSGGGEVLGTQTSGGQGAGTSQVQAPNGSVNAGVGGAPAAISTAAAVGLAGSVATTIAGTAWLNKRKGVNL